MESLIYITTKAYNAEKTLRRTIESVLSQSYGDFIYYICNNGSEDGTEDIIYDYGKIDKRIIPIKQYPNDHYDYNKYGMWCHDLERYIVRIMFYIEPDDWYVHIDADDDYDLDFLKQMLLFAYDNKLDLAACRSNFISEPDGVIKNNFILNENVFIEKEEFGTLFPKYYRFMGSQWGKLHSGRIFKRIDRNLFESHMKDLSLDIRGDTAMEWYFLKHSERCGILAKPLHNYHIYNHSFARQKLNEQIEENKKLSELYRGFLVDKVGYVSNENEKCISELYNRVEQRIKHNGGIE